jgi:signal transduction histidine kinase
MPHTKLNKILYIEDDKGLARLLQKRFERNNFDVEIAFSAEEGIEKIKEQKYDLILLDYHLPGMSGLEALDIITKVEDASPVIILTTGGDERIAVAALEKGAADYAVKDSDQSFFDLLPAIMQSAYIKEALLRENERQKEELSAAFQKAEAANEAKSNFLATMSHEIRTPLNVVTGLTSILIKTDLDEKQKKIVKTLSSNAKLLLKLINDLLDISRVEGGHVELESNPFEISTVLYDIKSMFEEQSNKKNINLVIKDSTNNSSYIGDETRFQQIIMNLVSNAIKFTDVGTVSVEVDFNKFDDEYNIIKIVVKDSGIGIEESKLVTVFDKFTQADETITRRYGGSGLGLSITKSLVKLMDGDIKVESEVNKGSTFTATLKLKKNTLRLTENNNSTENEFVQPANLHGKILLVEDYEPNIMVATMILEDIGFEVVCAENAEKAINIVLSLTKPFDAILMDVQMYGMDGLQATKKIREIELKKGFRHHIIGVTAHALAGDRERCLSAGMDDYISKPIHPDIIQKKLCKKMAA